MVAGESLPAVLFRTLQADRPRRLGDGKVPGSGGGRQGCAGCGRAGRRIRDRGLILPSILPLGHAFAPRPRSEWIFPTSFSKLTGFVSYSSQPAANAFSRLFSDVSEVTTTIGMRFVSGWPFRRRVASQPSSPGSLRSITIRSGRSVFAQSTPSAPFIATLTSNPARDKRLCSENRLSSLSSTQRILVIAAFPYQNARLRAAIRRVADRTEDS